MDSEFSELVDWQAAKPAAIAIIAMLDIELRTTQREFVFISGPKINLLNSDNRR